MIRQGYFTPRNALLLLTAGILSACHLPATENKTVSHAFLQQETHDTLLGRGLQPQIAAHPNLSGVVQLPDPIDAFASRILLIASAQRSVDVQYYIWRDDITGNLLLYALHEAAKRNVRIRLLIDDNGTSGLDEKLALLNAEPNVEVRLFNPFPFRTFKQLGFLTDFSRLNRRMHNKSLTVDGQATIVGGRNIGDEYFGATQGVAFADLDVMVVGPVVDDVSTDFDRYWNHQAAYPIEQLVDTPNQKTADMLLSEESNTARIPQAQAYVERIAHSSFVESMLAGTLAFQWVHVTMVSDDPDKVLGNAQHETMLMPRLLEILGEPTTSIDLVSPYFVPTEHGVEAFAALAKQGVRLRILTNAMEATDVLPVHAGYAKYRLPLLQQGVALYEMRREGGKDEDRAKEKAGPFGSSGSSLHAKTFAVDGKRAFVGSFNFDPRSAVLNTELGFVIESESMAHAITDAFDHSIPYYAYELAVEKNNDLVWISQTAEGPQTQTTEPSSTFFKRLYIDFLSLLPIESLL